MSDALEVHLPGERESEIDNESWVQSPGSLPGMTNKLCDAKNHFFSAYFEQQLLHCWAVSLFCLVGKRG